MDRELLISLAAQIPLVVLFALFVLKRDRDYHSAQIRRDEEWREFFKSSQTVEANALGSITEKLEGVGKQLQRNTAVVLLFAAKSQDMDGPTMDEVFRRIMGDT